MSKFDEYEDYLNRQSIHLFGVPQSGLTFAEETLLHRYVSDLASSKLKPLKIHDDGTMCTVSNIGKIYDLKGKLLKSYVSGAGYQTVWIRSTSNPKICYPKFIHRLVAEAFIPNPENKPEVNHINTDKFNNWDGNLEWVTHKENIQHSIALGHQVIGTNHANSKCTEEQIRAACKLLENPDAVLQEVSKKTGVPIKTITHIRFHNGWHHIAKDYKLAVPKRNPGPRYSPLSLKIRYLINEGMNNDEIMKTLEGSKLTEGVKNKTISDRIWYIRTKLI